jgi:hypothetical protein
MTKRKPAWLSILPGGLSSSSFTLEELRAAKRTHAFLTEPIPGPEEFVDCIRAFRLLLFFGVACVAMNKYPPLTRCWKELEKLFMHQDRFKDGVFVEGWVLMDFPFGPNGETALDYFERFLGDEAGAFGPFFDAARTSRLGLHQDVMRTKSVAKFRELVTGHVTEVFPSITEYAKGEILLMRLFPYRGQVFVFGDPKGYPKEARQKIEDMVEDKMLYFFDPVATPDAAAEAIYKRFMKLAGPYWMSCVTQNEAIPILPPDHYRGYLIPGP